MKKLFYKAAALFLGVALLAGLWPAQVAAGEAPPSPADDFISGGNSIVQYWVNAADGGFYILPGGQAPNFEKQPSHALFRLDGQDYVFGGEYPGVAATTVPSFTNTEGTVQTTWVLQGYTITQFLNLVQNEGEENSWAVYVGYEATKAGEPADLAGRIVLDTQMGANDDCPVLVPGAEGLLSTETTLAPAPASFAVHYDTALGSPLAYGLLQDARWAAPESASFGHFAALAAGGFGYVADAQLAFTAESAHGPADSGLAVQYSLVQVGADNPSKMGLIYGFSNPEAAAEAPAATEEPTVDAEAVAEAPSAELPEEADEPALAPEGDDTHATPEEAVVRPEAALPVGASGDVYDGVDFSSGDDGLTNPHAFIYMGRYPFEYTTGGLDMPFPSDPETAPNPVPIYWRVQGNEPSLEGGLEDGLLTLRAQYYAEYAKNTVPGGDTQNWADSPLRAFLNNAGDFTAEYPATSANWYTDLPTTGFLTEFLASEINSLATTTVYTPSVAVSGNFNKEIAVDLTGLETTTDKVYLPWGTPGYELSFPNPSTQEDNYPQNYIYWSTGISGDALHPQDYPYGRTTEEEFFINTLPPNDPNNPSDNLANVIWSDYWGTQVSAGHLRNNYMLRSRAAVVSGYESMWAGIYEIKQSENAGILPITKLNPAKVVAVEKIAEDVTKDGLGWMKKWDAFHRNYKLTLLADDTTAASLGTLTLNNSGDMNISAADGPKNFTVGYTAENTAISNTTDDTVTVNYKVVGTVGNARKILASGAQPYAEGAGSFTVDYTDFNLTGKGTLDVYVWLQYSHAYSSHEAQTPKHFQVHYKDMPSFAINIFKDADCTIEIETPALSNWDGYYPTGADNAPAIVLKNVTVPNDMRMYLRAYGSSNNASTEVKLTALGGNRYKFDMPASDVDITLMAIDANARIVEVEANTYAMVGLSKPVALPGETITLSRQKVNPSYYPHEVQVFLTQHKQTTNSDGTINSTVEQTLLTTLPMHGLDFYDYTLPADLPENRDLMLVVRPREMPRDTLSFGYNLTLSDTDVNGTAYTQHYTVSATGGWRSTGGNKTTRDHLPGSRAHFTLRSDMAYYGFDVAAVQKDGLSLTFTTDTTVVGGVQSTQLSFDMPSFQSSDTFTEGTITLTLTPKKLYQPYTIVSAAPNAWLYDEFESISVRGTGLEQVQGIGLNFKLLDATQRTQTQQVRLGTSQDPAQNTVIPHTSIRFSAAGDQMDITIPADLLAALKAAAQDTLTLSVGNVTRELRLSTAYMQRFTPFGVLGVVKDAANEKLVLLADSDAELDRVAALNGTSVIMRIRGAITYDVASQRFNFGAGSVMFNNALSYKTTADNNLYVTEKDGSVSIEGTTGTLSIPGFSISSSAALSCQLKAGVHYVLDGYATAPGENISIRWDTGNAGLKVATMLGLIADIDELRLIGSDVVFGGQLNLGISLGSKNLKFGELDIERLQFAIKNNAASFRGVEATGYVGMNDDFVLASFLNFAAKAEAEVNTFDGIYGLEVEVGFQVLSFEGKIRLVTVNNLLVPDELGLFIASEPGVPIPPQAPVVYLQGVGGGIRDISAFARMNEQFIPATTVHARGRVGLLQVITMDMEQGFGIGSIYFKATPTFGFGGIEISLGDFEGGFSINTERATIGAQVNLRVIDGFEMITGSGGVTITAHYWPPKLSFSGHLYCSVQLPRIAKLIGPIKLASAGVHIDDSGFGGEAQIGPFGVWFAYKWGDKRPSSGLGHLSTESADDSLQTTQDIYDADGNYSGTLSVGENLTVAQHGFAGAPAGQGALLPEDASPGNGVLDITVGANQFVLVQAPRDKLTVSEGNTAVPLVYPRSTPPSADTPYTETELARADINAVDFSVLYQTPATHSIMLMLDPGNYTITSGAGGFQYDLITATPTPKLTSVSFDGTDLTWAAQNLVPGTQYYLDVKLATTADNTGEADSVEYVAVQDKAITGNSGGFRLAIPDEVLSGDYYVWAYLKTKAADKALLDENGNPIIVDGETLMMSQDTVLSFKSTAAAHAHTNPLAPAAVTGFTVSPAGNGYMNMAWDNAGADIAYEVAVFDAAGNPVMAPAQPATDETGAPLLDNGGQPVYLAAQPLVYGVSPDMVDPQASKIRFQAGGLETGAPYMFTITPYTIKKNTNQADLDKLGGTQGDNAAPKELVETAVPGPGTTDGPVLLPSPNYPQLAASFENAVQRNDEAGNVAVYAAGTYTLNLVADQDCNYTILVNGEAQTLGTASAGGFTAQLPLNASAPSHSVLVTAVNKISGDSSTYAYNAFFNNTAPALHIKTGQIGVIFADASGKYTIEGVTAPGASVYRYGGTTAPITAAEDGAFALAGQLPAAQNQVQAAVPGTMVTVASEDFLGNTEYANIRVLPAAGLAAYVESLEISPSGTASIEAGQQMTIGAQAKTADSTGKLSLQGLGLRYEILEGSLYASIDAATGTLKALGEGTVKVRVLLPGTTAADDVASDVLTISIGASTAPGAPQVSQQPADARVEAGQAATFTVAATGDAPLSYQWRVNDGTGWRDIAGATSASYTTAATTMADNGLQFVCAISNPVGSVLSHIASLEVYTEAPPPESQLKITKHPESQTVNAGEKATFTVEAEGNTPIEYQWQADTGNGWANVAGQTTAALTVQAAAKDNGTRYRCVVQSSAQRLVSRAATLTVRGAPPPEDSTGASAQTGDRTLVWPWVLIGVLAVGAAAALLSIWHRRKKAAGR